MVLPDASTRLYRPDPSNNLRFVGDAGDFATVTVDSNYAPSVYTMNFQDGTSWEYSKSIGDSKYLSAIRDPWNNTARVLYNDNGYYGNPLVSAIRDADGKDTTFEYYPNSYLVKKVTDPFGRFAQFSYTNGALVQAVDMEGQVFNYEYNNSIISRMTTPHGEWKYEQFGPSTNSEIVTTVINPLLDKEFYYGGYGYRHIDTNGNKTSYEFIPGSYKELMSRIVYANLEYTHTDFNSQKLPNFFQNERGKITRVGYNNQGQATGVTDPRGNATWLQYANNGLDIIGVNNANNVQTMSATYDASRQSNAKYQPLSVTDLSVSGSGANGTSTFTYTNWGDPETEIDPQGRGTRYVYGTAGNSLNRLVAVQISDAPATNNGPRNWVTTNSFTYDNIGRVQTATDAANLTLTYEYDLADRVKAVIYPDTTREETTYLNGLPIKFKDRHGRLSFTEYDALQQVKRTWAQDAQNNNAPVGTTQFDYDKNGNLKLLTDTNGNQTRWDYDQRNRAKSKTFHDNTTETYTYVNNILTETKGSRGQIVKFQYDDNGNQTVIDYPNMPDVTMSYNKLDDVTRITDAIGIHVFGYDNFGRQLSNDGPLVDDTQTYAYDALQRIQTQTVQRGASGGVQSQTFGYDALGRLASLNANGTQGTGLTTYSYEGNTDRLRLVTHPNGTRSDLRYDGLGRLQHVFNGANGDPLYNRYSSNYDTRDIKVNTQPRTGSGATPYITTYYAYDALDQLKQERVVGGVAGVPYTSDYNYDGMGNRTQVSQTSASGSWTSTSTPNALNQLTSITTAVTGGTTATSNLYYDTAGNLTTSVLPNGNNRTTYNYGFMGFCVG